jgi:alpha-galactosidase
VLWLTDSFRFQSSTGFSSHLHNPFVALIDPTTTESQGDAWGFSLVYTGSFAVEVEKSTQSITRTTIGLNPNQFNWPLKPGESFISPEAVTVFSDSGVGGMSRKFHRLYRNHLIKSKYAKKTRPVLLNSWEGLYFNVNESSVYKLASQAADLGVKLFVLDDGWFANGEYSRVFDTAGLGDWEVNTDKFPNGLTSRSWSQLTRLLKCDSVSGLSLRWSTLSPNSTRITQTGFSMLARTHEL